MSALHRVAIAPVSPGPRPTWSVMVPTYNCARYLGEALRSVLAQDPGPDAMQIEVVDDHSTRDDPAAVVKAVGQGRVGFFRQESNVGITRNFATCLQRARGRIVHLLHGDDYVLDGFYETLGRAFAVDDGIGAAFCRQVFVDGEGRRIDVSPLEQARGGRLANGVERLATEQRIMTPSIAVRRDVYERLGGFDERLRCSEDWEMWVRIAARYPVWYEPGALAAYRMHLDSNTGRHLGSADDVRYTRLAIDIFADYLPQATARRIVGAARKTYARAAIGTARALLAKGDPAGARAQLAEALRLSRSPGVLLAAMRAYVAAPAAKLVGRSSR